MKISSKHLEQIPITRRFVVRPHDFVHISVGVYKVAGGLPTFAASYDPVMGERNVVCKIRSLVDFNTNTTQLVYSYQNWGREPVKIHLKWVGGQPPLRDEEEITLSDHRVIKESEEYTITV